jgi:hypothetical protein
MFWLAGPELGGYIEFPQWPNGILIKNYRVVLFHVPDTIVPNLQVPRVVTSMVATTEVHYPNSDFLGVTHICGQSSGQEKKNFANPTRKPKELGSDIHLFYTCPSPFLPLDFTPRLQFLRQWPSV